MSYIDPEVSFLMCRLRAAVDAKNIEKIKELQQEAREILKRKAPWLLEHPENAKLGESVVSGKNVSQIDVKKEK